MREIRPPPDMSQDHQPPQNDPSGNGFQESHLEDPEYRDRLMRKLNCLIAVLEVANAKVKRSLAGPDPDLEKLKRIRTNLSSTLEVCKRAKRALERREALPDGLPENLAQVVRGSAKAQVVKKPAMPIGSHVEMSSEEERRRFEEMGPITRNEVAGIDFDELARRLQD